jgi:hypothetical protein
MAFWRLLCYTYNKGGAGRKKKGCIMHFFSDMGHVFSDLVHEVLDAIFTFLANLFGTIQDYVD